MLVDTMLQGYGWQQGWQILQQISANAKLADAGATFISDDVGSGQVAGGLTMDFFAASAIAHGKPLFFTYPESLCDICFVRTRTKVIVSSRHT